MSVLLNLSATPMLLSHYDKSAYIWRAAIDYNYTKQVYIIHHHSYITSQEPYFEEKNMIIVSI
jgi:hypothetical protein